MVVVVLVAVKQLVPFDRLGLVVLLVVSVVVVMVVVVVVVVCLLVSM